MHFTNTKLDEAILSEIFSQEVISQTFWSSLAKPNEGDLTRVLVDHGDKFCDEKWAFWLVKRHGFTRMASLEPDPKFYASLHWTAQTEKIARIFGCYPFRLRNGIAYLASVRPDLNSCMEELLTWLKATRPYIFAITPKELKFWANLKRATI
jgi:hypothetical protein